MAIAAPPRVPGRAPEPAPRKRRVWIWTVPGAFLGLILVAVIAFMALFGAAKLPCFGGGGGGGSGPEPSATAVREIPPTYLVLYRQMGTRYDVDWSFLASIGAQESDHGRNAVSSSAGCIGVMQLCGAFTQPPIAQDGNGDGDIQLEGTVDIADSIASAASGLKKLKGAPPIGSSYAAYRKAACGYYGACADGNANYADEVMQRAVQYGFGGAGSPAPTDPSTGPTQTGPDRSLLSVGDSLAVGTQGLLRDALPGWGVKSDAKTSRPTAEGVSRLEALSDGDLPSVLAVSLGSNDSPSATQSFRQQVDRVVEIAGPNRCVLWFEIRRPPLNGVSYGGLNRVLRRVARSHDNLHIVDAVGQLAGDGVHLTSAGYRTRAKALADEARSCIGQLNPTAAGVAATAACANAAGAGQPEGVGNPDAAKLATNPNITWAHSPQELSDLRLGRVSPRLIALLSTIAETHKITIFALASDHKPGTNHEAGRAADIAIVDDDNCYPPNRAGACWALAQTLDRIDGCLHSTELIYYFDPGPSPDSFARSDHDDHIHVGYDGPLGPHHYAIGTPPCSQKAITGT